MAKSERQPMSALDNYLPEGTSTDVVRYLQTYKVQLTITRARTSVLGDYRNAHGHQKHRISVNGNLNKYAFLITLLHELAHLFTYERYKHRVPPHGQEWKQEYGSILASFVQKKVFPEDIHREIERTLHNPGASTCSEPGLMRVLKKYDPPSDGLVFIENLKEGDWFVTRDNLCFQMGNKRRTRYLCTQFKTGKQYMFNGLYEVKPITIDHTEEAKHKELQEEKRSLKPGYTTIENLQPGDRFKTEDDYIFTLVNKRRTRYLCTDASSKKQYLLSTGYPVKPLALSKTNLRETVTSTDLPSKSASLRPGFIPIELLIPGDEFLSDDNQLYTLDDINQSGYWCTHIYNQKQYLLPKGSYVMITKPR